jgi:iron complex outermembrane recepter protein
LFGRNTTGGAVSYTSKRPSSEFEGYAELGYGNYQTVDAKFGVGGPISDSVRVRLAGIFSDQGKGHYKNTFTPAQNPFGPAPNFRGYKSRIGEDTTWAARLVTEMDIGADGLLTFNLHGGKRKSDTLPVTPIGFTTIPGSGGVCTLTGTTGAVSDPRFCGDAFGYSDKDGDPFTVSNDYVGYNRDSNLGGSAKLTWDFGGVNLTSITAYESANKFFTADSDGGALNVFNVFYDIGFDQFSQELRLNSKSGGKLYWIAGLYYSHDKITQAFCGDLNPLIGIGVACRNDFRQISDAAAAYGQVEYNLTEQLRLTGGLRYSWEKRDFFSKSTLTGTDGITRVANFGSGPQDDAIIDDSFSQGKFSGRIGLDFKPNDDVLIYANASRGYKSGGYDGDFAFIREQLEAYDAETLTAYEIGFKTTLADGIVRFNGAAFYYDYKKPQIRAQRFSSIGLPYNKIINLDGADLYGAEIDLTISPTKGLDLQATVALLDSKIKEDSTNPSDALFNGNDFALAAKTSFTLMARYETDISENWTAALQLDGKYNGPYQLNAENVPYLKQSSYVLANARFTVAQIDKGLEISLWGKNLLNESFSLGSYALFGAFPIYYNNPRTYGMTLGYKW